MNSKRTPTGFAKCVIKKMTEMESKMIFEHEIPSGSRLYFGKSAKLKRKIEQIASETLEGLGFEEIVTPLFSYHQHESFEEKTPLVRLNDGDNYEVTLRADSTADVVRIVTKRLGRSSASQRWFYIQPTVSFPTIEQYQIGAEIIGGEFAQVAQTVAVLIKKLNPLTFQMIPNSDQSRESSAEDLFFGFAKNLSIVQNIQLEETPIMQISNIRIPHLLSKNYGVALEILKAMHIEQILKIDLPWIEHLVSIHSFEDLSVLDQFPDDIREELEKMRVAIESINYSNIVVSPLFYAKMRYYDSLTFRMFEGNTLLATGGTYTIEGIEAAGFALFTDGFIAGKIDKGLIE